MNNGNHSETKLLKLVSKSKINEIFLDRIYAEVYFLYLISRRRRRRLSSRNIFLCSVVLAFHEMSPVSLLTEYTLIVVSLSPFSRATFWKLTDS